MATELLKRCLQHNRVGFLLYIELESIGIHFNKIFSNTVILNSILFYSPVARHMNTWDIFLRKNNLIRMLPPVMKWHGNMETKTILS